MRIKKMAAVIAVAAGMVVVGVGSASAGTFNHSTTGATMTGTYSFQPKGVNHGGFLFSGTLADTDANDGNAPKLQVKAEAYGWSTWYAPQKSSRQLSYVVWDGAMTTTQQASAHVCRDRGSFYPDNCSSVVTYRR